MDRAERYEHYPQRSEAAAARVVDSQVASTYLAIAVRWCKMADEQRELDEALTRSPKG
jgi:hypothetical protein